MSKENWPKRNRLQAWFLGVYPIYVLLLILIGCVVAVIAALLGPAVGNIYSNIYSSHPTCHESVTAKAWLDQNGNGKLDTKELSLPGIRLSIKDSEEATDSKGEVDTLIWTQCKVVTFTVAAEPPPGYRFTTPNIVTVTTTSDSGSTSVYFGLAYLPGVPTVTPRPPSPQCVSHLEEISSGIYNPRVAIAQNGAVWAAFSGEGLFRYDATRNDWIRYSTTDGLVSTEITSIAVDQDNAVWIGTEAGLTRFDGISWSTYTRTNGLPSDSIDELAISPRGGIWIRNWTVSLSYFDFRANSWKYYRDEGEDSPTWSHAGAATAIVEVPNDSVWMGTTVGGIFHLIPDIHSDGKNTWTRYETIDAQALYVANDNSIWVAGKKGVARFDPITEKWTVYHHTTDNFTALDQAQDGSLWSGTRDDGVRHLIPAKNGGNDIWETYTSEDGLVSDEVMDVKVAPDGTIWFATAKGLSHCTFASKR